MTFTCLMAWAAVVVLLPVIVLLHLSSTRQQAAKRMRSYGWSQQRIADRLGCSRSTVRRLLA